MVKSGMGGEHQYNVREATGKVNREVIVN